ncbi:hypothetical protein MU582_02995 [Nocardioidaceae bacterium SCSIO 66511]|nr:hypothetical protein MU582_02995 [Nocardioidaceae bacterium SCSIO 66511]
MRDDWTGLRRSLESGVRPPSFDALSERAAATKGRGRQRTVLLATCAAAAAIVVAGVSVTAELGDDPTKTAAPSPAESAGKGKDRTVPPEPQFRITVGGTTSGRQARVTVGQSFLQSARRLTIEVSASGRGRFETTMQRGSAGNWTPVGTGERCTASSAPAATGGVTHLDIAADCIPEQLLTSSDWRLSTEDGPSKGTRVYTGRVGEDGRVLKGGGSVTQNLPGSNNADPPRVSR